MAPIEVRIVYGARDRPKFDRPALPANSTRRVKSSPSGRESAYCYDPWDSRRSTPDPLGLATLLKTLGQELLRAVSALLFLLLNLLKEGGQFLVAPGVAGVLHVEVRPLEGMVQNTHEIVSRIFGAGFIGHG